MDNVRIISDVTKNMVEKGVNAYDHPEIFSKVVGDLLLEKSTGGKKYKINFSSSFVEQNLQKFFDCSLMPLLIKEKTLGSVFSETFMRYAERIRDFCEYLESMGLHSEGTKDYVKDKELCMLLSSLFESREDVFLSLQEGSAFLVLSPESEGLSEGWVRCLA